MVLYDGGKHAEEVCSNAHSFFFFFPPIVRIRTIARDGKVVSKSVHGLAESNCPPYLEEKFPQSCFPQYSVGAGCKQSYEGVLDGGVSG